MFSIMIHLLKIIIIINKNCLIRNTSKYVGYRLSKIFKSILVIFSYLFFGIIPKMLNVIKFIVVLKIIYYLMMFAID